MFVSALTVSIMVAPVTDTLASKPTHASINATFSSKTKAAHNKKKKTHEKATFDFTFKYDPAPFTDAHIDNIVKHSPTHPGLYYRKPTCSQPQSMEAHTTTWKKPKHAYQTKSIKSKPIPKPFPEPKTDPNQKKPTKSPPKKPKTNNNKTNATKLPPTTKPIPNIHIDYELKHPYHTKNYTL